MSALANIHKLKVTDYSPADLSSAAFIEQNDLLPNVDIYIRAKTRGCGKVLTAFAVAFGADHLDELAMLRVNMLEANPLVQERFFATLKQEKPADMWDLNQSIYHLRHIAVDPTEKAASRINAIKELNVLMNITYTDDKGNTRRTLADFYREANREEAQGDGQGATKSGQEATESPLDQP